MLLYHRIDFYGFLIPSIDREKVAARPKSKPLRDAVSSAGSGADSEAPPVPTPKEGAETPKVGAALPPPPPPKLNLARR